MKTIGFVGGGNMAASIIGGLVSSGFSPDSIFVTDLDQDKLQKLQQDFGICPVSSNAELVEKSSCVVLAVKPQVFRTVLQDVLEAVQLHKPLVVSIAAGIREKEISRWLGGDLAIVRTMPNTPALVQAGVTGMYANNKVLKQQRDFADTVLSAVGSTVWLQEERQLDAVTAVSGSGPAYFFLIMEAMESAAQELGMDEQTARQLVLQTAFGAAKIAVQSDDSPITLRHKVTSPGGTTEQGVLALENGGVRQAFESALKAAENRSIELGDILGEDA